MNHKKKFFVIENETRTAVLAFYNGSEHLTDVLVKDDYLAQVIGRESEDEHVLIFSSYQDALNKIEEIQNRFVQPITENLVILSGELTVYVEEIEVKGINFIKNEKTLELFENELILLEGKPELKTSLVNSRYEEANGYYNKEYNERYKAWKTFKNI